MINIKKFISVMSVLVFIIFISYILFPNWSLEVIKLLKKPETFISFLTATLGILGAYFIANYQLSKSLKYAKPQYLQNLNAAQVPIKNFLELAVKIENVICTGDRINAKNKIYWSDFEEMEENLYRAIKTINPKVRKEFVRRDLAKALNKINEDAPPYYFKSMNFFIYQMIYIYDALLIESEYLDLHGDRSSLKYIHSYRRGIKITQKRLNLLIKNNKRKYKQFNLDSL